MQLLSNTNSTVSFTGTVEQFRDLMLSADSFRISQSDTLETGTGTAEADTVWSDTHKAGRKTIQAEYAYTMDSLGKDGFNNNISFQSIKTICIRNTGPSDIRAYGTDDRFVTGGEISIPSGSIYFAYYPAGVSLIAPYILSIVMPVSSTGYEWELMLVGVSVDVSSSSVSSFSSAESSSSSSPLKSSSSSSSESSSSASSSSLSSSSESSSSPSSASSSSPSSASSSSSLSVDPSSVSSASSASSESSSSPSSESSSSASSASSASSESSSSQSSASSASDQSSSSSSESTGITDDDMVLLLHMDGTNGGTTFTDKSCSAHTITASGDAQTRTAVKKLGTASYRGTIAGAGKLTVPDSADFAFSTNNFTIDFWMYPLSLSGPPQISAHGASGTDGWYFYLNASNLLRFDAASSGSGADIALTSSTTISINTWYHVAVVRNGSTFTLYVDGVAESTDTDANAMPDPTGDLVIGDGFPGGVTAYFEGHIDEYRILNGKAYWAGNFDVPTVPYANCRQSSSSESSSSDSSSSQSSASSESSSSASSASSESSSSQSSASSSSLSSSSSSSPLKSSESSSSGAAGDDEAILIVIGG